MIKFILRCIACIFLLIVTIIYFICYIIVNYILGISCNYDIFEYLLQAALRDVWIDYDD